MYKKQKLVGFILTRQWRDSANGINLSFWVSTEQGPVHVLIEKQQAVCFIRRSNTLKMDASIQRKPLKLKTFEQEPVDGLYFSQQRQLNTLREHLTYNKQQLLESEIKPTERYLMERFITASVEIRGVPIQRDGYREFINPVLKPTEFNPDFRVISLDIETEDLRGKLYSIAATSKDIEVVFMNKVEPETHTGSKSKDVTIHWCQSEREVLQKFFHWLKHYDPDVIIGWNVVAFDLDFLQWKCKQLKLPFDMGRGSKKGRGEPVSHHSAILAPQASGQMHIARIPGRVILDGITSLRGAFYSFESFALDYVSEQLLGRKKLINDEKNKAISGGVALDKLNEIRRQYREDPMALAEYNLEDCRLVAEIFKKTDLLNFSIQRAKMTGLTIDRQGGSTAAFDNLYLPRLHRQGYVAPDIGSQLNTKNSPGGYVMDSLPGLYENVLVLDFKSLYPSIIRTFKIDPMGLAEGLQKTLSKQGGGETIPGFLDAAFSRDKHILPDIVTRLWQQRDEAKKENNKPLSYAIKIIMNSFYGVLGSSGCRFFNPQLASSITMRGHEIIQTSKELIEQQGYSVIYGDTDSVFVLLGEGKSTDDCQVIGKQLQEQLNTWWKQHLLNQFAIESNLEIEFETHYLRFLMPTIRGAEKGSKKRYAGMVLTDKNEKKMVFKGLESVRTDWTPLARDFQKELYRRIFNNEPYEAYIAETHDALINGELNHKLIYTKRLRRPLESYTSTQPPQVKAARKMKNPGRKIQYIITLNGPEPIESVSSIPDYQHYVDKQLAPVADSILYFVGTTFEKITARQLDVFG